MIIYFISSYLNVLLIYKRSFDMIDDIGSKIKDLRKQRKICQEDISCKILSRSVLSKIENNKIIPSILQLNHISKVLEVPIEYFLTDNSFIITGDIDLHENEPLLKSLYSAKKYLDIVEYYERKQLNSLDKNIYNYFYIGMSYFQLQLYNQSLEVLKKFISLYAKVDDSEKLKFAENYAVSLNVVSCIMHKNSNYDKAISYLNMARITLIKYNLTASRVYFLVVNNSGAMYCKAYRYNEAISLLENFLINNNDITHLSILPNIHVSLNIAYYKMHKYEKAIEHIQKAIMLFKYTKQDFNAGECYLNYINCLRYCSQYGEALDLIEELKQEYKNEFQLVNLFNIQKTIILFNMKQYEKIMDVLTDVNIRNMRRRSKIDYYFIFGYMQFLKQNYKSAYSYLSKCINYFKVNKLYRDLSFLYEILAQIMRDEIYNEDATKYKQLYMEWKILNIVLD
jgi:tetratricopeptide (TPR) repeat protein